MNIGENSDCDNCGNDVEVEVFLGEGSDRFGDFLCFPCREATKNHDDGTLSLRCLYLRG